MNHNIKHLKLFEGLLSTEEIPYSSIDPGGKLNINLPNKVKMLPSEYNQITNEITGDIIIDNNPHITEITGFNKLKNVGWDLSIKSNKSLTGITGFNELVKNGWDLSIKSNKSLTGITGFNELVNVGGGLHIESNQSLTIITGFYNLENIGWCLNVRYNHSLIEVSGFDNLIRISYSLYIESNKSLTKITGYKKLTDVGDNLAIKSNASLTEITGFNNLTRVGIYLYIQNNPKLVTMSIPGNIVRVVNYNHDYGIAYDNDLKFKSPSEFINSPVIMDDLVTRFNPGDHGDVVIKQIIENIEEWGTEETKTKVYSFLGKYLTPEHWKLVPTHIQYRYHPDYQGTTG